MKYLKRTSHNITENFTYNLLKDRGVIEDSNWKNYIKPTKENENSPFSLDNMEEGVKLLNENLNNEILVIADSDFDGFSSAALIWNFIKELNSEAKLTYLLPEGKEHGFQTKMPYLLEKKRADLIIMPDAGSNDHEEMKQLKEFGYKMLTLD